MHPGRFTIEPFERSRHLAGCTRALITAFEHNHWPLWKRASPRLARDVVLAMASACDLNLVAQDGQSGDARGQIFCMAPAGAGQILRSLPAILRVLLVGSSGLYFMRPVALRHLLAVGRGYAPLISKRPTPRPHFEVLLFAVDSEAQGMGLGVRLMNEAVTKMARRGAARIALLTDSTMGWRFYERYGYERVVEVEMAGAYRWASGSRSEQGYAYELDVAAKQGLLIGT